ncbi:hypothetical protein [Streptomyces deserti]
MAERVAPTGVRVNAVSPSATRTHMITSKDGFVRNWPTAWAPTTTRWWRPCRSRTGCSPKP